MADEPSQDPGQDTLDQQPQQPPAQDTATEGQTADTDWEARYKDLQSEYTRTTQENAQLGELFAALQDPEQQAQVLEHLGLELADQEDTPPDPEGFESGEYVDPVEQRLGQLEEYLAGQQESEQQADFQEAEFSYIDEQVDALKWGDGQP